MSELDAASIEELRTLGSRRNFKRGQRVVFEGARHGSVVLIESGRVKIVSTSVEGDEVVLAIRGPGQILGDLSAITGTATGAGAVALGAVTATMILGSRYVEFLERHPKLLLAQFRRLVAMARESDEKLLEMATLDVPTRVARRLLDLVALGSEPTDEGVRITTELSQEELAGMCGASREAVARTLKDLRDAGVVVTDRRRVTVTDLDGLRARS